MEARNSFWFLVRKSDRTAVGCADFKDIPSKVGEVEIVSYLVAAVSACKSEGNLASLEQDR